MRGASNSKIKFVFAGFVLVALLGMVIFAMSGGEETSLLVDQNQAKQSDASPEELSEQERLHREKLLARQARIRAARAKAAEESGLDRYGRKKFDARDPSTWSDVIDPANLPKGFDPKDPATFSILEDAYRAELERRAERDKARRRFTNAARAKAKGSDDGIDASAPASGTLEVIVRNEKGEAIKNISVYAPITEELKLQGGQVAFTSVERELYLKSDADGLASFDAKALDLSTESSWPASSRIVVQSLSYATIVRELKTRDLQHKKNRIEVTLVPAVMVEVKVVDREGQPVPEAFVVLKQGEGRYESMGEAFTASADIDGRFTLKVARDYRYIFSVSAKGFVPQTTKAFDFTRDEKLVSVTLQPGRGVEGYVHSGGETLEGAKIHSETDGVTTYSDSDGYFVLAGLKDRIRSNRVRIRVTKQGHAPVVRSVLVNEEGLEVDLPEAGVISGTVSLNGAPVSGATVMGVINQEKKDYPLAAVVTNELGEFSIAGIGAGNVKLTAASDGFFSPTVGFAGKAGEEINDAELKLGEGAKALGTVMATFAAGGKGGLSGVSVLVDGLPIVTSLNDGTFAISGLSAGTHLLSLKGNAEVPDQLKPFNLIAMTSGETLVYYTQPAPKKITSKLGEEAKVEFALAQFVERTHREITIRFQLNTPDNIAGIEVVLVPSVASAPSGHKTAPIRFQFALSEGSFTKEGVSLLEDVKYTATIVHPRIHKRTISAADLERVEHESTLEVDLERAMSFRAYVKDTSGNAVVGVGASVNGINGSKGSGRATTDQHGYFEIGGLDEGDYHVRLFKNSYYELRQNVKTSSVEGETPTLTLLGANEIRVRVVNSSGQPQPASRVWAVRPGSDDPKSRMQYFNLGETDGEGRKVVNFHWIRHYQVTAYKGSQIAFVNFDNLKDKQTREFDIVLEPSVKITGKVTSETTGAAVGSTDIYAKLDEGGDRGNNWFITRTKGNGTFSLTVPQGSFSIVIRETRLYLESTLEGISGGLTGVELLAKEKDIIEGNFAQVLSLSAPANLTAGESFTATITLKNRGSTTWSKGARYALGTQSPKDTRRWGPTRIQLPHEVGSGSTVTFTATLTAPTKPGKHNLAFRMVQDGKEWFGGVSQIKKITVELPSSPPPSENSKE